MNIPKAQNFFPIFRVLLLAVSAVVILEGTAILCRTHYGLEIHPKFSVKAGHCIDCYVVNELGALGHLRSAHDRTNVAVVAGSSAVQGGSDLAWPNLLARSLAHAHLDNFSVSGPDIPFQEKVFHRIEKRRLRYDILYYEPATTLGDFYVAPEEVRSRWYSGTMEIGGRGFVFPRLIWKQAQRIFLLDPAAGDATQLLGLEKHFGLGRAQLWPVEYGPYYFRDIPNYFSAEDEQRFRQKMVKILTSAKRVASKVVVLAPIMHYHGAPNGSDQSGFNLMLPTREPGVFVSLKTFAETIWRENQILKETAQELGLGFFDGNAVFSHSPHHEKIFRDQFHLVGEVQAVLAERLLRAVEEVPVRQAEL